MLPEPFFALLEKHGFTRKEAISRRMAYYSFGKNAKPEREPLPIDLLWPLALDCGWTCVSDWKSKAEVEADQAAEAAKAEAEAVVQAKVDKLVKQASLRYQLSGAADLMNAPPTQWLIRDVLPASGIGALYGPPGSGKSFLLLDMCAAVASGQQWFGHFVQHAVPVVYAILEGQGGFGTRLKAWSAGRGGEPLPERLRFLTEPFDLRDSCDVRDLCEAALLHGGNNGGLIVIDTLSRAAPGTDENSASDMGELIAACAEIQRRTGGAVLVVHHTGKDTAKGLRGHSSLNGAVDVAIEVSRTGDYREWTIAKSRDSADGTRNGFRLELIALGNDEHSQPVSSYVVEPIDGPAPGPVKKLPATLQVAKPVYDMLTKESAVVTFGQLCAAVKSWYIGQGRQQDYRLSNLKRDYKEFSGGGIPNPDTVVSL